MRSRCGGRMPLVTGIALLLAHGAGAEPRVVATDAALRVQGPAVVFVAPAGPSGDALREQQARLRERLEHKRIKVLTTEPTLIRLGQGGFLGGRLRQVDFRKTPAFHGTLVFAENRDPQIQQGLETDADLVARIEGYLKKNGGR